MGTWRTMYESNTEYLSAADLDESGRITLTIAEVREQKIESDRGKQRRPVIHWRENVRPFIVNKTNIILIEAIYGADPSGAIGKPLTIRWDPTVKRSGETVGGLRIAGAPGFRGGTVKVQLPQRKAERFRLENTAPPQPKPEPSPVPSPEAPSDPKAAIGGWLASKGIEAGQLDKWLVNLGKNPLDDMHPSEAARLFAVLDSQEDKIRAS